MTDSISEIQAERRRAERPPIDWPTYRDAIVASGMVEESRQRREENAPIFGPIEVRYYAGASDKVTIVDELYDEKHGE